MSNELIINASLPETRIALIEDGQIQELLIERASGKGIVGNIYKGRVTRVLPGMQAAFVDIGLEKAAFLYVDDVYVHSEIWEEEENEGDDIIHPNSVHPIPSEGQLDAELQKSAPEGPSENQTGEAAESIPAPTIKKGSQTVRVKPVQKTVAVIPEAETEFQAEMQPEIQMELLQEGQQDPKKQEGKQETETRETSSSESEASEDLGAADEEALSESESEADPEPEPTPTAEVKAPKSRNKPVRMGPPPGPSDKGKGSSSNSSHKDKDETVEGTIPPDRDQSESSDSPSRIDFSEASSNKASSNETSSSEELSEENAQSDSDSDLLEEEGDEEGSDDSASMSSSPSGSGRPSGAGSGTGSDDETDSDETSSDPSSARPRKHRRGKRGGRFRKKGVPPSAPAPVASQKYSEDTAESEIAEDRSSAIDQEGLSGMPSSEGERTDSYSLERSQPQGADRPEFKVQRSKDRRIRPKTSSRLSRPQINIQDLLKEGQEILVQVAKDPIATKGARLTCHISLPGRHLVCMPTIDHVGVSRRIEREEERRRLREYVERNRPKNLGFIVRTASGKQQSEKRIKQDIEYLTRLWTEIKEKASTVTAPALVYEDLNVVLRAIRDWVTEEIDKVIVDSRYHFNDILRFVSHFMPPMKQKVELYHGDIPIFDAYGISTELSRALERKVWLKSGGYIVVDQAEALVAIDVNTGRYVGKKNLEDTILKTNLEAVQEIAYQLRLRNCGGIIIIDLIDMEKEENRQRVYRTLEEALLKDRARPTIMKISELGLVEMTRKRTRDTIVRSLCESCNYCEGKGFIKSKQTVAYEVMREIEREGIERDVAKILIQAHPDVIDILAIDERDSLDQMERRYRKTIYLQAIVDFHPEQFEVSADKKEKSEKGKDQHSSREPSAGQDRGGDAPSERGRGRRPSAGSGSPSPVPILPRPLPISIQPVTQKVQVDGERSSPIIQPKVQVAGGEVTERGFADSVDEAAFSGVPASSSTGQIQSGIPTSPVGMASGDESFDEEDRLAFLRAQAAQDAALARLNSPGGSANRGGEGAHRGERPDRGGIRRNTRPPRRGNNPKFRGRTPDRNRDNRGPKNFSGPTAGPSPIGPKWVDPSQEASPPSSLEPMAPSLPLGNSTNGPSGGSGSGSAIPTKADTRSSEGEGSSGGSSGGAGGGDYTRLPE